MDPNIVAFLKVMEASDNTTGGGTASGVAGAMAAGLAAMVARLSIGKKALGPNEHYEIIAQKGEKLAKALFNGGREDAEAFSMVSTAYKMPKDTEKQKNARRKIIQSTMLHATEVPLKNAEWCKEVLIICRLLEEEYNTNAMSDLQCANYLANAGLLGCVANVRINIASIQNKKTRQSIERKLKAILEDKLNGNTL